MDAETPACPDGPDPHDNACTLDDLCTETGESRRTVRFYILNGLLSAPVGAGPAARYPRAHALRLRVIRALQDEGRQLAVIRSTLEATPEPELPSLLEAPRRRAPPTPEVPAAQRRLDPPDEPRASSGLYRSQWEHIVLAPGLELQIRRPLGTSANRKLQRILDFAQKLGMGAEP